MVKREVRHATSERHISAVWALRNKRIEGACRAFNWLHPIKIWWRSEHSKCLKQPTAWGHPLPASTEGSRPPHHLPLESCLNAQQQPHMGASTVRPSAIPACYSAPPRPWPATLACIYHPPNVLYIPTELLNFLFTCTLYKSADMLIIPPCILGHSPFEVSYPHSTVMIVALLTETQSMMQTPWKSTLSAQPT